MPSGKVMLMNPTGLLGSVAAPPVAVADVPVPCGKIAFTAVVNALIFCTAFFRFETRSSIAAINVSLPVHSDNGRGQVSKTIQGRTKIP